MMMINGMESYLNKSLEIFKTKKAKAIYIVKVIDLNEKLSEINLEKDYDIKKLLVLT